jgi:hypothetical protein
MRLEVKHFQPSQRNTAETRTLSFRSMHLTFNNFLSETKCYESTTKWRNGHNETYELHWNATTLSRALSHLTVKSVHEIEYEFPQNTWSSYSIIKQEFPQNTQWSSYSIIKQFSIILKLLFYYKLRGMNTTFLPNIRLYSHTAFFRLYVCSVENTSVTV